MPAEYCWAGNNRVSICEISGENWIAKLCQIRAVASRKSTAVNRIDNKDGATNWTDKVR